MPKNKPAEQKINTGGGAYIGGDVSTGGGDFVGRDKVVVVGSRGVAIGGNVSGSTIITGDGNVIGQPNDRTLLSLVRQIEDIVNKLPAEDNEREEILLDIRRIEQLLLSIPINKRILLKRLRSLVDFVAEMDNVEIRRQILPRAKRALTISEELPE